MKTAEEIIKYYCIQYGGVEYIDREHALKAMKSYAQQERKQAVEVALRVASEKAWLIYHDGTTKSNNHGQKQINIGNNHIKIDPLSILSLAPEIMEELNNGK